MYMYFFKPGIPIKLKGGGVIAILVQIAICFR